jgi:hypothetical protein
MWKIQPQQRTPDEMEEVTQPAELLTPACLGAFLPPFAA